MPLLHRQVELALGEQHDDAGEDRERPRSDQDRPDGEAGEDDARDEGRRDVPPGTLAFGFRADLDRGWFLPTRSAEPLRTDANGPSGLGLPGPPWTLLAEELRDRNLFGGLGDRLFGLDVNLVPNGLGEVVGRGLDGLDVRRLLGDLGTALLDQLGDAGFLAREVDIAARGGFRTLGPFVIAFGLRLQQERADPVALALGASLGLTTGWGGGSLRLSAREQLA